MKAQELQGHINSSSSESFITGSSSSHTSFAPVIEEIPEPEHEATHKEKLDNLKQKVPKFSNDLKFWPIFDTQVLSRYSYVFFYYYELYLFLLKLLLIMTVLAVIFYTVTSLLKITGDNEAELWLYFGYGLVTIVAVRLYCMKEEKHMMQGQNHPREDWTENKFALLVERIPLHVSKTQIKLFFEDKMQGYGFNDGVREVILLQECSRFTTLSKKLRRKQYTSRKTIGNKQSLIEDIERVQDEINQIQEDVDNLRLYKGTAIVIFETIRGKITVENLFKIGKIKRFIYRVVPSFFGRQYRLDGEILKVKEAPEPSAIIFEKIYVPRSKIIFRKLLTYFLGNLAVLAGIGFIVVVRLNHTGNNLAEWLDFPFYSYSAIVVGIAFAIYLFTDYLIDKIMIHRTKFSSEMEKIRMRLIISYLSINAYLVILMQFVPEFQVFQDQLFLTAILLAIFIPLRKLFSVISIRKLWLRRKLYKDPYCFEKYSEQEIIDIFTKPEYDFANNVEDSVCFMFFALGFYFIGQLEIVVITLLGLIVSICVDKLVIVHFTSPTRIKGSEMGLEFFRILRWDIRLQLLTIAFLPGMAFSAEIPLPLRIVLFVGYGVFLVWDFSDTLAKKWKQKWSHEREETHYADVEQLFHHKYENEYPFKIV